MSARRDFADTYQIEPHSMDARHPYNDLPLLPPKADVETRAILKKCVGARTALAELRLAGQLIPDQSALVHTIRIWRPEPARRSRTSSPPTMRFSARQPRRCRRVTPNKRSGTLSNALYDGEKALKAHPLSTRIAIEVCRTITGIQLDVRRTPGTP